MNVQLIGKNVDKSDKNSVFIRDEGFVHSLEVGFDYGEEVILCIVRI